MISDVITDTTLEIPVLDLNTLEETGVYVTVAQIYEFLHAYYHYAAKKRDSSTTTSTVANLDSTATVTNVDSGSSYDVAV